MLEIPVFVNIFLHKRPLKPSLIMIVEFWISLNISQHRSSKLKCHNKTTLSVGIYAFDVLSPEYGRFFARGISYRAKVL